MTEEGDIDGLAGEYVLGSLDATERAAVDARRRTDAALAAAIAAWERRLGPLSELESGIEPPPHVLDGIMSRIARPGSGSAQPSAEIIPFRRQNRGRIAFVAVASALAACVAGLIVWKMHPGTITHTLPGKAPPTHLADLGCGARYKDFWVNFGRESYERISAEKLAGVSRMALRAYDACEAGDQQDAASLFERLKRMSF